MVGDTDFQVWLDTQSNGMHTVLIPYVRSARDMRMSFRLDVIQTSGGGTSRISQKGKVNAAAAKPEAIARIELGVQKDSECRIELALREGERQVGSYSFDCSRPN